MLELVLHRTMCNSLSTEYRDFIQHTQAYHRSTVNNSTTSDEHKKCEIHRSTLLTNSKEANRNYKNVQGSHKMPKGEIIFIIRGSVLAHLS
jgi:hypothetical protein